MYKRKWLDQGQSSKRLNSADAIKYAVDHNPDIIIASRIMEQMGERVLACVLSKLKSKASAMLRLQQR